MYIFDSHCDTASCLAEGEELLHCGGHWSLERAHAYDGFIQFFAAFVSPEQPFPEEWCITLLDGLTREIEKNSKLICQVTDYQEMKDALNQGKVAAFFTVEGGFGIDLSVVEKLYHRGVRCMSLCWNQDNALCGGVGGKGGGLTKLGRKAVEEMNRLGMLIDVSHCSDQTFFDFAEYAKKPLIATHSNSRSICTHKRNLTDEQFCIIRDGGGMVGLNFYPPFLNDSKNANVTDFMRHLDHFLSLGGEHCLGLGADFDGVDSCMTGISGIESYRTLYETLCRYYSESMIKALFCENYITFLKNNL